MRAVNTLEAAAESLDRRALLGALRALKKGDLSVRMPLDMIGIDGEIAQVFNDVVEINAVMTAELARIREEVGKEGRIDQRLRVPMAVGSWATKVEAVNALIGDLVRPTEAVARVIESVAHGDLSQRMLLEIDGLPLRGEFQRIGRVVNTMVNQLNGFASEVSRVAREVGTEGKLGGQAQVPGVAGTWKDLTDNVNAMAANLTGQVRNIAEVTTAVAKGDLSKKITVDVRGEILELKSTINTMVDQLNGFASEVSRVAGEVGTEGKLGGQARVPGVAGTWKDLTDNVNQLAENLTTQVRAIAEVATAVTKGDLTRSIMVEAMGEVAALKDNINEMIRNLKDTTLKNNEQDWLKTNLAKFSRMLQGQGDLVAVSQLVLSELAPLVHAQQGVLYTKARQGGTPELELLASYAGPSEQQPAKTLRIGESLLGQCALDKKRIMLEEVESDYFRISSALGSGAPLNVVILPVLFEGEVRAVLELASFKKFNATYLAFLDQLAEGIGIVFNTIEANMRTSDLLQKSQSLTKELQNQQEELTQTNDRLEQQAENLQKSEALLKMQQEELRRANEELQRRAELLSEQMRQVEYKNEEIELAKAALEEKAEQLAQSSRYKSEFLANMSHELRTPLNSLLILAKLLADNSQANLTPKQIDFAQTIHAAGADLLSLISDILDLAKIESGTVTLDMGPLPLGDLCDYVERTFRPTALEEKLDFIISIDSSLPAVIETDEKRLQQILKNLLSNAFKFTEKGHVDLRIRRAESGWSPGSMPLETAEQVIAFEVHDTGVGIPENKQKVIFEAFQQADGTTSREYGGTGLGLSISRELTRLFAGEITVKSVPGKGSTFVLYLPVSGWTDAATPAARTERLDTAALAAERATARMRLAAVPPPSRPEPATAQADRTDDRDAIEAGDRVLLLVEEESRFAETQLQVARELGFKAIVAPDGGAGLELAQTLLPDGILLDLKLPDLDGWVLLDLLKHNVQTRHIPVSLVSVQDPPHKGLQRGALTVVRRSAGRAALREALLKTRELLERKGRALLIADGDAERRAEVAGALASEDIEVSFASGAEETLEFLRTRRFDCVLLAPRIRETAAPALLRTISADSALCSTPFVIYGAQSLEAAEQDELRHLLDRIVLRTPPTRKALLEEITLFLHRSTMSLPQTSRTLIASREADRDLANRKVLIVDDDVRNLFALTGALEQYGMSVLNAENGKEAIELLKSVRDVEMVLMDIMMPELDGYDTIRIIRGHEEFKDLPIIAVTAKAMKGDREKCIDAGASDYIAKPVNVEQLTSLLRVWLNR